MSLKPYLTLFFISLAIFLVIFLYSFLSIWHLWHLLPEDGIRIAINQTKPGTPLVSRYLKQIQPDLKPALDNSRRLAVSLNQDNTTLVIVPRQFLRLNTLISRLNNQGWNTHNYGLIIVASRGEDIAPSIISSLTKTSGSIFNAAKPFQPALIWHIPKSSSPYVDDNMYGLAVAKAKALSGEQEITLQMNGDSLQYSSNTVAKTSQENGLQLAIPSDVLSTLPIEIQDQLQDEIMQHLPFKKTKPNILPLLTKQEWVQINIDEEDVTISLKGNIIATADQFITWSKQEEAFTRPQRRPFQLPDKTLAYEEGPGELKNIFQAVGNDCRGASWPALDTSKAGITGIDPEKRVEIWICREGDTLAISNNQEQAKNSLLTAAQTPIDSWNLAISAPWLQEVAPDIQFLHGEGDQTHQTFTAILSSK